MIDWDEEAAEKGGYETFMLKEIHEQPTALADTLTERIGPDGGVVLDGLGLTPEVIRGIRQVVIVACGTSYHAGLVGKYALERWARMPVEVEVASEFRYRDPVIGPDCLCIAISQSGETADTLAAMRLARQAGAQVLAVTNIVGSQATREADGVLFTRAGLEIGVAATKTFLTQVLAMLLLSLYCGGHRGHLSGEQVRAYTEELRRIPGLLGDYLEDGAAARVDEVARAYASSRFFLCLGRNLGLPVALEGALKLKEISYIPTDAYAAGEMKHGPIALLEEGSPVLVVATDSFVYDKLISNVQEVKARGPGSSRWLPRATRACARWRTRSSTFPGRMRCSHRSSRSCRCSCSPTTWPRTGARRSTSRAIWPRPSRWSSVSAPRGAREDASHGYRGRGEALVGLDLVEVERFRGRLPVTRVLKSGSSPRPRSPTAGPEAGRPCTSRPVSRPRRRLANSWVPGSCRGRRSKCGGAAEGTPPQVVLSGRTAQVAQVQGICGVRVSLSHVDSLAGACAVVIARPWEGAKMDDCSCGEPGRVTADLVSLAERPAVFTPAQMRELDRATIEQVGVPGPVLMERAALGVSSLVLSRYSDRHTLIVCGQGNNGGDGLAAARQLHLAGHPTACVVAVSSPAELSPDAALNFEAAQKAGVNLRIGDVPDYLWDETELVVDCLLGTGSKGELRGRPAEWARRINAVGARGVPVLAVDVPSGVDATTGSIACDTVAADVTVTFHAAKSGLVCPPGSEAAGEVLVWDIGLPGFLEPEPDLWVVTADDVNVPGRRVDDHKYRAGYVAVLAGSRAYPGAAWLTARAAYRTGAGYVRLLMSRGSADGVRGRLVEVVLQEIGAGDCLDDAGPALVALADERLGAAVIGPGLGRASATVCGGEAGGTGERGPRRARRRRALRLRGGGRCSAGPPRSGPDAAPGRVGRPFGRAVVGTGGCFIGRRAPRGGGHRAGGAAQGLVHSHRRAVGPDPGRCAGTAPIGLGRHGRRVGGSHRLLFSPRDWSPSKPRTPAPGYMPRPVGWAQRPIPRGFWPVIWSNCFLK